jgi:hypothetical protein
MLITELVQYEEKDSHHHVFYPNDCFVFWFDPIEALPNYKPVTDDITCEFEEGLMACRKLSDFVLLLHVGTHVSEIAGKVGQIQNPTSAHEVIINRIDFFTGCLGYKKNSKKKVQLSDILKGTPDDTTASSFKIEFAPDEIFDATIVTSTAILGNENEATIEFKVSTEFEQDTGHIEIETGVWAKTYDGGKMVEIQQYEGLDCSSEQFETLEIVEKLKFKFTGYKGKYEKSIIIKCKNWRNPLSPEINGGYVISV